MANKGSRLDKVLEMIGLVEREQPQDNGDYYQDEYPSGDYGRQPAYTPPRNRAQQQNPSRGNPPRQNSSRGNQMVATNRRPSGYTPTRASGSYDSRSRSYGQTRGASPSGSASRRPANQGARQPEPYDYTPRAPQYGSAPAEAQFQRPSRSASRQRTVMLSLHELSDCGDVIDNLIAGNTVVLTMDDLNEQTMQRAVDTLSGAVFALHATFRRASGHTFLIAPTGVEVNDAYEADYRF